MKKILLLVSFLFAGYINDIKAQTLAQYLGFGGTSTTVTATAANETVSSLMDVGFGANTPCASGGLSGITVSTAWTVYSTAGPHVYFQILPNAGYTLTITDYWVYTRRSATGPTLARLAYSLDGGTTWVDDGIDHTVNGCSGGGCCGTYYASLPWAGSTGPSLTGITSAMGIIFAIFPYAPSGSTGTFQVQEMDVNGTVNIASAPPIITSNPTNVSICAETVTSFSATATGLPTPTYQWQRSMTGIGGPWVNITTGMDGGIYGASFTTNTLVITGATVVENGYAYQMVATNSAGSATSAPALLTVLDVPTVAAITGITSLCSTGTSLLSDATGGGVWSSTNTGVATVSGTGLVSGVAGGITTISYTVSNSCGSAAAAAVVTVTPPAAAIVGTTNICTSSITTLTNTTTGGTWSSSNPAVASVLATTGVVTAVAQGTATITYTVTNACGTTTSTTLVTVSAPAAAIIGTTGICIGATSTLTNTTTGGTWTSSNPAIATIGSGTGIVTGIAAGTSTITYTVTNACGTTTATTVVTINAAAGTIIGTTDLCMGSTSVLTNTTAGGTWTSSNPAIATIGSAIGLVTAIAQGTTTITYTVISACGTTTATTIVTVDAVAAAITGVTNICIGGTSLLSNTTTGGTWTSSNTAVATIDATGLVTGIATGTGTITYSVTNACGTTSATIAIAVFSSAGLISGTSTICVGTTITLTNSSLGGIWSSGNPSVATITPGTGILTGLTQGNAVITYMVTNPCGTTTATLNVTVNRPVSIISGPDTVCIGTTIYITDSAVSGTWSASNGNATITASGVVTGIAQGFDIITYTVTNACGTSSAIKTIYIQALPLTGTITGPTTVCSGRTINVSDAVTGGIWSSSNITATISSTGLITGVYPGNDTIFYTLTNGCGSASATKLITIIGSVTPAVSIAASPGLSLCPDIIASFTATPVNGGAIPTFHWYVNGIMSGGTGNTYSYIPSNTDVVKCELISSATCPLPDSVNNSVTMAVSPPVIPSVSFTSSGGDTVCEGVNNTFNASPVNGGTLPILNWSVNWINVGTGSSFSYIPANGDIVICSLTSTGACVYPDTASSTKIMTVLPYHTPAINISVNPGEAICEGNDVTVSASPVNGGNNPVMYWTKNGNNTSDGWSFTYRPSTGDSLTCTIISNYHCVTPSDTAKETVILNVSPIIVVNVTCNTGMLVTRGVYDTLTAHSINSGISPSYQWYKNGIIIPGAVFQKLVRNDFNNQDSVSCIVTTGSGTPCEGIKGFNWIILEVAPLGINTVGNSISDLKLIPNPNTGEFIIKCNITNGEKDAFIDVTDVLGQVIYSKTGLIKNGQIAEQIKLNNTLANGIYLLHIVSGNEGYVARFTINR